MITRRIITGLLFASALCLAAVTPASAAGFLIRIQNFGNNLCLQPLNDSTLQGEAVVQVDCDLGKADQIWEAQSLGGDAYRFRNVGTDLCLDARGGAANGTLVQQWTCNGISNEKWVTTLGSALAQPIFSAVAGSNHFCLDVPNQTTVRNTQLQIYDCNATVAQLWYRK